MMKTLVKCKACGYVMEASSLRDKCPACGVPAKQFEAYDDKLSDARRTILQMHIHPVIVHIPQAFAATLVVLSIGLALLAGELRTVVLDATRTLAVILPFSVAASFAAGLFDGKVRFRRVTTPILLRKMMLGGLFFLSSLGTAALALSSSLEPGWALWAFAACSLVGLGAGGFLGMLGSPLMTAKFPG
jgi:rubredoxin